MSNKNLPMDEQLFMAEQYAPMPEAMLALQAKDVTLNNKMGDFPAGSKFAFAILLGDASAVVLIDENQKEHAFRLNVSVGEAVDVDELKEPYGDECGHDHCGHEH